MYEELTKGHCLIVPIQHAFSTLELDDDDWEEIKVKYELHVGADGRTS